MIGRVSASLAARQVRRRHRILVIRATGQNPIHDGQA
jgi:hypothetical protein